MKKVNTIIYSIISSSILTFPVLSNAEALNSIEKNIENIELVSLNDTYNVSDKNTFIKNEYLLIKVNKEIDKNSKDIIGINIKTKYEDEEGVDEGGFKEKNKINKFIKEDFLYKNGLKIPQGILITNYDYIKNIHNDYEIKNLDKGNAILINIGQTLNPKEGKNINDTKYTFGLTTIHMKYDISFNKYNKKGNIEYKNYIL